MLYPKARRNRINFEESCGIIISENPVFPAVFLYLSLILIIASIVCLIFALRRKHKIRALAFVILLILGTAILVFCSVKQHEKYGICRGCKIYSIPQENADSVSEVASGNRVRILEKAGKWYYIEIGESGGWCNTEDIYIIK